MENYSLRIENLLSELYPDAKGTRALIAKDPYEQIFNILNGRVSLKILGDFSMWYSGISGKSIDILCDNNYDLEKLIYDLKQIVEIVQNENN